MGASLNWALAAAALAAALVPGRAQAEEASASDAQPGLVRVGIAEQTPPALAATFGYGLTEAQHPGDGTHHRFSLRAAGAFSPIAALTLGPIVDARYDVHPDGSGAIGSGGLLTRLRITGGRISTGAELKVWVPGAPDVGTAFSATSFDGRLLLSTHAGGVLVGAAAGYRFDRSAKGGANAPELAYGDRLALGLSDFDAVLVAAGVGVPLGRAEILAEASADVLVGRGAPPFGQSPLRFTLGSRYPVSDALSFEAQAETVLSGRPEVSSTAPLIPIEPRFTLRLGLRYRFRAKAAEHAGSSSEPAPAETGSTAPLAPAAAASVDSTVVVAVSVDPRDPRPAAKVSLKSGGQSRELAQTADQRFRGEHVPPGDFVIRVEAPGFETVEQKTTVRAGAPLELEVHLTALPPPSQVRGAVRSFDGKPIVAKIRVEPLGAETTTDEAGTFELDVPPGKYEVSIEAPGYAGQRRSVRVEAQSVVIIDADLGKMR